MAPKPPLGCQFEDVTCQNGGMFPAQNCSEWVQCGITYPNPQNWQIEDTCSCEPQFDGSDCSIVRSPQDPTVNYTKTPHPCPSSWDGSFNPPVVGVEKHMECFLDFTATNNNLYDLRLHRIEVTVRSDKNGWHSIDFDLSSRHRNLTMGKPGFQPCAPTRHDLVCQMSECATTSSSSSPITFNCPIANCTSCGEEANITGCSSVLGNYVKSAQGPVTVEFDDVNGGSIGGYSSGRFYYGVLIMGIECSAGQCLDEEAKAAAADTEPLRVTDRPARHTRTRHHG